jgi:uncharacterized linocin/CFP29 family protein
MSKHPLDLPPGRKLSKEEIAEALRLSIIAELDAINLYLQLARAIDDSSIKKVFEDIAKEEKTHVGEFLTVLKTLDPEQVEELRKGAEEVKGLTGMQVSDPRPQTSDSLSSNSFEGVVVGEVRKLVESTRVLTKKLPTIVLGRGVEAVVVEQSGEKLERAVLPLCELSYKFRVSQKSIDHAVRYKQPIEISEAVKTTLKLVSEEERLIIDTLIKEGRIKLPLSSWDTPGNSVIDVAKAVAELVRRGYRKPFIMLVSPERYVKLLSVSERIGITDLERVKTLIDDVVSVQGVPTDKVLIVSAVPEVLDVVYGGNAEVDYIGPEDGLHTFRLWSTITLRVKIPDAVVVMEEKQS